MTVGTGTVWSQLRDFQLSTGDYHIRRDPRMVNLAGYNRYLFHTVLMNNIGKAVQGGDEINYEMFFDVGDTYDHPLPAAFRQWKRVDIGYQAKQKWAKNTDHKTWIRDEIIKNKRRGGGTWFDVLFDMDTKLEQRLQVSRDKGLEDDIAAVPDYNSMESRTFGTTAPQNLPYSIFAHINEDAYGQYGQYVNTSGAVAHNAGVTTTWTLKQQFDPTTAIADPTIVAATRSTRGKYVPLQKRYTSNAIGNNVANIFGMLRTCYRQVQWEGPTDTRQWYESTMLNNFRILTSDLGIRVLEGMIKEGQDRWIIGPTDLGVGDVMVHGIPIKWWPKLDDLAIYDAYDAGNVPVAKVTEAVSGTTDDVSTFDQGPRFYGINFNCLYPVVHEEMWRYREAMPPHFNVPDVFVEYIEDWWNLICEDYRQHFVLSPYGAMYSA
jgi:hypothetical protein